MPDDKKLSILVWLILAIIWSTTWIFIKIGIEDLPPLAFASSRFVIAIAVLFIFGLVRGMRLPRTASDWKLIAITGGLQFSINYSAVFWAEQHITSGLAAVLQATITVFGLLLAWIFLPDERITARKVVAVATGIGGVTVIFADQLRVENWMAFAGCVVIVVGSYAAAQASILTKARGSGIHPATLVMCQMICGVPPVIIYSLASEGSPFTFNWTWRAIGCILYLSLLGTITAFWLYYWLLRRVESTKAMMISLVTPLLAVVIGWLVLGETLPPQTGIGGLLIIGSIGLIVFGRREKKLAADAVGSDR